jgi:hypothetical protein
MQFSSIGILKLLSLGHRVLAVRDLQSFLLLRLVDQFWGVLTRSYGKSKNGEARGSLPCARLCRVSRAVI